MKKIILCFLIYLNTSNLLFAQWECPSQLGGSLKQINSSDFSYGIELTGGAGYLTNSVLFNQMSLLGLNYTSLKHTFYFEGGIKTWYQGDYDLRVKSSNNTLGLRELFYNNQSRFGSLTLGLQSIRSEDVYLVNERVLGINYKKDFARFGLNIFGGAVSKQFARNGTFCNMAYLYDILPYTNQPLIGQSLGQTNLAGVTFSYHSSAEGDEFSDDGLGEADTSPATFNVETLGWAIYSEFGSWLKTPSLLTGIYSDMEIGNGYHLKPEILLAATGNTSVIYCAKLEKAVTWANSHRTAFDVSYYGQTSFNSKDGHDGSKSGEEGKENEGEKAEDAKSINSFSNIFAGTVLRFDTPDMPFLLLSAKHTIPSLKTHLKVQYVSQANMNPNHELDIEVGKKFFGKLLINATYGYIKSPALISNPNLFRIEMRFTF